MSLERAKTILIGESMDTLAMIDFHVRGIIRFVYAEARKLAKTPLTLLAAESLVSKVKRGDTVIIGTGFTQKPYMVPETDGLLGAIALARALNRGLGAYPVIIAEEEAISIIKEGCKAAELNLVNSIGRLMEVPHSVYVMPFPKKDKDAINLSSTLVEELQPAAIISIERPGRNEKGVYHTASGKDISDVSAKFDFLFELCRSKGILTIGIGDLGNELGMGLVNDVVKRYVPNGDQCKCGCGGGIGCVVPSEVTVIGATSDNAALGIIGCLSNLLDSPNVIQDDDMQKRMLEAVVRAGAVDGPSGLPSLAVDLLPLNAQTSLLELIRTSITCAEVHTDIRSEYLEYYANYLEQTE
jgi:hypothetical protein